LGTACRLALAITGTLHKYQGMTILRSIMLVIGLLANVGFALAEANAAAFDTLAKNAILIDAKSGFVFFEKDSDTPIPPASMSKLMTQAIVFDMLKRGDLKLDQEMTVSVDAWKRGGQGAGGSTMYAEVNSRISLDNLLHPTNCAALKAHFNSTRMMR